MAPDGARRATRSRPASSGGSRRRSRRSSPASSAPAAPGSRSRPSSTSTASRAAPKPSIPRAASCARPRPAPRTRSLERSRRRGQRRQRASGRQPSRAARLTKDAIEQERGDHQLRDLAHHPDRGRSRAAGSSGSRSRSSSTASTPRRRRRATYQPRPQEELDRIAALVRTAIGFDKNRGDQIEVVNLRFAEAPVAATSAASRRCSSSLFSPTKEDLLRLMSRPASWRC